MNKQNALETVNTLDGGYFGFRVSEEDRLLFDLAAAKTGMKAGTWARTALVLEALATIQQARKQQTPQIG